MESISIPSQEELQERYKNKYGFVPNLVSEMLQHPAAAQYYDYGVSALEERGLLSPAEQHVVYFTISHLNKCHYCTTAHKFAAKNTGQVGEDVLEAITKDKPLENKRLNALVKAARLIHEKKGWLTQADMLNVRMQGVTHDEVIEVLMINSIKTMSNYINHIKNTTVDVAFGQ